MRLAHTQPETRTGLVGDQGGMWILVSRGDVNVILALKRSVLYLSKDLCLYLQFVLKSPPMQYLELVEYFYRPCLTNLSTRVQDVN
jgi:hypothetical protein